ncbi:hypothetical protein J1N35_025933, partial [Gossypium stocksii]
MIHAYVKTLASTVGRGSEKENILCLYNKVYWVSCFFFSEDLIDELEVRIVVTLETYGVKNIVGIPFGYRGFSDKGLAEMP